MKVRGKYYRAVWMEHRDVVVINQPLLPHRFGLLRLKNHRATAHAIKTMIIRGAGTIGATAAYGMAQAWLEGVDLYRAYRTLLETRAGSRPRPRQFCKRSRRRGGGYRR